MMPNRLDMGWPRSLMLCGLCVASGWGPVLAGDAECINALTHHALDVGSVGADADGLPALGTYERISPDGRFILRSYSGAQVGAVTLMELPDQEGGPIKTFRTPFSNEAFPIQGTWRYLVNINGDHYRLKDVLERQSASQPLFRAGMTGFYAAASEFSATVREDDGSTDVVIRSLSWPQGSGDDAQGVGPLQVQTVRVRDDGRQARVVASTGPSFICSQRASEDGGVFALPMISIDGRAFSAIPQVPRKGQPSMRVYSLSAQPTDTLHPCALQVNLGLLPSKAVFGFPGPDGRAWLTYSDIGHVYVFLPELQLSLTLDQRYDKVLATAFPGLTRDGRVIYGATWQDCTGRICQSKAGYVVADPYQSSAYRAYWGARGQTPPKACITHAEVQAERQRFSRLNGL